MRRKLWLLAAFAVLPLILGGSSLAAPLPSGFQESVVFSGLNLPTKVRFAPDGRVFVAEKSGTIKVFSNLSDTTPTVVTNLAANVHDYWDRGMLGFALDPNFATNPYMYVLYTYDAPIGGSPPTWGDGCPSPPAPNTDGCVVSGRLSRLPVTGDTAGPEQVLIEDWCQQFPSHSIGSLQFGADGKLYVSGGDGASFNNVDYGQYGGTLPSTSSPLIPRNPCGDPPGGVGGPMTPPTAEGGALRSQSLRRQAGEPIVLDGTILRVDPATGNGLPDNPFGSSSDANARRIVASGLRNPFRITIRPGTNEVWVGDVGWNTWEEINRLPNPTQEARNFGWPCYEGVGTQSGYDGANLNICENLYSQPPVPPSLVPLTAPYYTYNHSAHIASNETTCTTGSSSISGLAFYQGGSYPSSYNGSLFFTDHSRNCIWVMNKGVNGLPDPASISVFADPAAHPVDLEIGPGGDLFYVDYDGGTIRRIQYFAANQPPIAVATASPTNGPAPLTVNFDGSGSSDPDGNPITYSWDLDGDGVYGDSTAVKPTRTYSTPGTYTVRLRVSDNQGATTTSAPLTISVNNTPPTPVIDSPSSNLTWKVGDRIPFSGHATDSQDGTLAASALTWTLVLQHCPSNCHTHLIQTLPGDTSEPWFTAPDHEYPSYLQLQLTARDSGGLTATTSVDLQPQTVDLTFASAPSGLQLTVNNAAGTAPFTRRVIVNSTNSVSADTPQTFGGTTYTFGSWSDGGAQTHTITAPASTTTYTATYLANRAPTAVLTANPTTGTVPLTVQFSGAGSSDPDGNPLAYSWDLNGDSVFGDSTAVAPTFTYTKPGNITVRLRVTDPGGLSSTATVQIRPKKK
jgi:PKD repeat protein